MGEETGSRRRVLTAREAFTRPGHRSGYGQVSVTFVLS